MRTESTWLTVSLVVSLLAAGCTSLQAPTAPEAAPATEALPSAEIEALPEASVGDPRTQCDAGGAKACLRLCTDEAEVCDENDDSDECKEKRNEKAESVEPCSATGFEPGTLCTLAPTEISPTQAAVGLYAVDCKAKSIAERGRKNLRRYLLRRPVPMVAGPGGGSFITDRHHTSTGVLRAEIDSDRKELFMCPMADRRDDPEDAFWSYMVANNFAWLFDRKGEPIGHDGLPPSLAEIADDPYRTLSRWVRDSCGYIKCGKVCGGDDSGGADTSGLARCIESPVSAYFLEFHWANYLRDEVEIDRIYEMSLPDQGRALRDHLGEAMEVSARNEALDLGLPGWNGGLVPARQVRFEDGCDQ